MTSYSLCMTTQHCVLLIPHSGYVWHHLNYRWYHIHSITWNHSIYDVTSTSGITSHPLYQTSHSLYLCHHNLFSDIIPTFVWHHTHYTCDIIYTVYNIISTPYFITLLYLWHHRLYIWNHIEYVGPHIHYTCDITATNWCPHTHSIDNITHILYDITLARFGASFALYKTSHTRFMTWNHHFYDITPTIFDTVSMYLCHHIHCIDDITPTEFLRFHPLYMTTSYRLYMTSQPLNVCHHTHPFNDITPFVCRTSHPLYV